MFINLLNIALRKYDYCTSRCQKKEIKSIATTAEHPKETALVAGVHPDIPPTSLTDVINTIDETNEVSIIKREFGELFEGRIIEIELSKACDWFCRKRKRVDAFKSIISKLRRDYGVTLTIKSRKTK